MVIKLILIISFIKFKVEKIQNKTKTKTKMYYNVLAGGQHNLI